ncbi:MAG: hypothetical protein ACXABO_04050 [Promethearchaeota archaeon]|jgi:hypothetical protein
MSVGKSQEISQELIPEIPLERESDISHIIIPFSQIFNTYKPSDIYSGAEKIPFKERDSEFKVILRQEFSGFLR